MFAALWASACGKGATPTEAVPSASATVVATAEPTPSASASADAVSSASEDAYRADAGPSVVGQGSVDGAALRKRHVERLRGDTSPVTVLRGQSALELGERICDAVMPKRPKDMPILLKPNLCGFDGIVDPAKAKGDDGMVGRTTDVEFSRGVVRCLKKRGHTKITIAEGCGISHAFWQEVADRTGYTAMAREEAVALVAMDDDGVFDVEGDKPGQPLAISGIGTSRVPTLLMPKILAEHLDRGLFVSLPKIKTHRYSVTSMAIKGMQGVVMLSDARPAYKQKYRMHRELNEQLKQKKAAREAAKAAGSAAPAPPDPAEERKAYVASLRAFGERMVDMLEIAAPDVVLADGAPAMGGDGFQQLYPSADKVAVGGTNPVLVDRVGAEVLGLWNNARLSGELLGSKTSPLIELAAKRFGLDLAATKLAGDGADLFASPRPVHFKAMAGFSIHSDATPAWQPVAPARGAPPAQPSAPAASAVTPTETPTAAPTAPTAEPAADGKPTVRAVALGDASMTIDGRADDAAWSRAAAASWDTDWSGAPTGTKTTVRFAWSSKGLFALYELEGAGLFTDRTKPVSVERAKLYEEDCVELFLGHDAADPKHYVEVELGPFGHFFDLDVHLGGKTDTGWSSGAVVGTTRDPAARRATIEVQLKAAAVLAALRSGARLPLGLYRMEGAANRKYLAWSPTKTTKPNFHVPEAFGVLVIE